MFGAAIVLWPSKKFTHEELIPGGGAASLGGGGNTASIERILEELKNDPGRLGETHVSPVRAGIVDKAIALLPQLEGSAEAQKEFVFLLRSLVSPGEAHADDGSAEFFVREPSEIFAEMSDEVVAPLGPEAGGSAGLGNRAGARPVFETSLAASSARPGESRTSRPITR